MKRVFCVILALLITSVFCFAGGQTESEAAAEEQIGGSITVYTSMRRQVIEKLKVDFEAAYPGTTIDLYRSGTSEVLAKLQAEDSAGAIQADVLSVADMSVFRSMYAEGQIFAYQPKGLEKVPDMFKHENGAYNEVRWSGMSIIWNTNLVKTPPKSWKDLLRPEYKGKIVMPDPQYSGTVVATIGSFVTNPDFGWKFFEDFAANGGKVVRSNGEVGKTVAGGEFAIGMIVDGNAYNLKEAGSPVDYAFPVEGTVLLVQPIAILSHCENKALAKAFLDYVYSEEAMRGMTENGYVPVLPGTSQIQIDFDAIKLIPTDWNYIDENRAEMVDRFLSLFN